MVVADGRLCKLCGAADTSMDPVYNKNTRKWYHRPVNGKNSGEVCVYCGKVRDSRYKLKYTVEQLAVHIQTKANYDEFRRYLEICIEHFVKAGCYDSKARVPWTQGVSMLVNTKRKSISMDDDDEAMIFADCVKEFGDPATLDNSHYKSTVEGVDYLPGLVVRNYLCLLDVRF